MERFHVERTTIDFETALTKCKIVQLEEDAEIGDIFGEYILTGTCNPLIIDIENHWDYKGYFKKGMYVNLFPIKHIKTITSDCNDLNIKGFVLYEDRKTFYKIEGFDKDFNEISSFKNGIERSNYYYINQNNR